MVAVNQTSQAHLFIWRLAADACLPHHLDSSFSSKQSKDALAMASNHGEHVQSKAERHSLLIVSEKRTEAATTEANCCRATCLA